MKPSVLKAILKQAVSKPEAVARIQKARKAVNTKPSPAQAESGVYAKGHVRIHGLDISIENPKGSIRRGVSKSGTEWACKMFCDYGYLKRTTGADAEPVDCFIGEHPHSELVFCVDQMVNGKFDELKVMLGFLNAEDAKAGYLANYAPGWNGCGHVTPLTMEQFKSWLENGDETKPMEGQRFESFHKKADAGQDAMDKAQLASSVAHRVSPFLKAAPLVQGLGKLSGPLSVIGTAMDLHNVASDPTGAAKDYNTQWNNSGAVGHALSVVGSPISTLNAADVNNNNAARASAANYTPKIQAPQPIRKPPTQPQAPAALAPKPTPMPTLKRADGENYTCKGRHNTCPSCGCEERCKCGEKHHNHTEEVCAKCNDSGGAKDLHAPAMKKADSERRENKLLRHKHEAKDLATCPECAHLFVHNKEPEIYMGAVACPKCGSSVTQEHCGEKKADAEFEKVAATNQWVELPKDQAAEVSKYIVAEFSDFIKNSSFLPKKEIIRLLERMLDKAKWRGVHGPLGGWKHESPELLWRGHAHPDWALIGKSPGFNELLATPHPSVANIYAAGAAARKLVIPNDAIDWARGAWRDIHESVRNTMGDMKGKMLQGQAGDVQGGPYATPGFITAFRGSKANVFGSADRSGNGSGWGGGISRNPSDTLAKPRVPWKALSSGIEGDSLKTYAHETPIIPEQNPVLCTGVGASVTDPSNKNYGPATVSRYLHAPLSHMPEWAEMLDMMKTIPTAHGGLKSASITKILTAAMGDAGKAAQVAHVNKWLGDTAALNPHLPTFKDTRPVFTHGVQVQPPVPALPTKPQVPAVPAPPMIAKSAMDFSAERKKPIISLPYYMRKELEIDSDMLTPEDIDALPEHKRAAVKAYVGEQVEARKTRRAKFEEAKKCPSDYKPCPECQGRMWPGPKDKYPEEAYRGSIECWDCGKQMSGMSHRVETEKSAGLINGLRLGVDAAEFMMLANATKKKKEGEDADAEEINPEAEEHDMATNIADTIKQNPNVSMIDPHKKPSIIPLLQTAKAHSDAGRYDDKAAVMRSLFTTHHDEFEVDQDDGGTIVGVTHKPSGFQMHLPRNSVPLSLMNKSASAQEQHMLTMVPAEALAAIRAHGLLSGDELAKPENRHLLELARPDGDAERWLKDREDRKKNQPWNTAYAGPSVLFGAADPDKITDQHPTKRFETVPVRIRLAQLLADHPDTRVHGSELIPFDENYDNFSEEQKDEFVHKRHHDLTAEELHALIAQAQNPKEFWKHYHDPEGKTYAANVPHGHVITSTGKIDPKYLEFPDDAIEKQAATAQAPLTGPEAIMHALSQIDMTHLEKLAKDDIKSGKVTRRGKAVKTLNIIEGLRRNKLEPHHLMISKVPVLPPIFRPFSVAGGSFVPGDANELYKDLFTARDLYRDHQKEFGATGAGEARLNLYNAVKACYGYGEPVNAKTKMRGVSGFLAKIVGSSPKHGWMLSKMISKPMDSVSRGVVAPNPNLGVDEIGIPEDHAWSAYAPHIQRKLVLSGQSPLDAIKSIKERDGQARRALELITTPGPHGRPVIYSRAPAWHKFSVISAWPKIIPGHIIQVNPYVTTGANMDFDGDFCIGKVLTLLPIDTLSKSLLTLEVTSALLRGMFKNLNIPTFNPLTHTLALTDLEDFPHGPLTNSKEGANGRIDFFQGIPGTMVIAYDEKTNKPVWAPVAFCSKHFQREVEIVTLRTKRQIVTDNDPRAVYAIDPAAGTLTPARFTPTEALEKKVVVPFVRNAQHVFDQAGKLDAIQITTNPECAFQHVKLDWDFGYFLGAMCGDGWWDKSDSEYLRKRLDMAGLRNLHVSDLKGYNAARVKQMLEKLPSVRESMTLHKHEFLKTDHPDRYGDTVRHSFNFKHSEELAVFLSQHLGGEGDENTAGSGNKKLPCFLVSTSQEFREGLLCGLIDTDGTACISNAKDKPQLMVAFTSTSLRLVRDVQFLCLTLGILTSISFSKTTTAGNTAWLLSMSSVDCKKNGCLAKLQSPWKRDAFLNTPVSTTHGNAGVGNTVVFPRHIAEKLLTEIASPKITKALRKIGGAQVEEKKAEQLIYQWAYQGAKDGYLTRNAARKVIAAVEAEYTARQTLVTVVLEECEEALNTGRLGSDTISRLRKAISYLAPHYGKQEKYSDGQRIASRLNSPKKTGRAGPKLLNGLIAWLRGAVLPAGVLEDSEIKAWIKIVDEETVAWSPVESVEKTGIREDGYDLTVPGYETFMAADGIILSNTLNVHVPATDEAVQEAKDKLMPTKMLFTIRNPDKIMPVIKHETILGLHSAVMAPAKQRHIFPSHAEALSAIKRGQIALSDEIDIAQPPELIPA